MDYDSLSFARETENVCVELYVNFAISAGVLGVFVETGPYMHEASVGSRVGLVSGGAILGVGTGFLEHLLKGRWIRAEEDIGTIIYKKVGIGILCGALWEVGTIGVRCIVGSD